MYEWFVTSMPRTVATRVSAPFYTARYRYFYAVTAA